VKASSYEISPYILAVMRRSDFAGLYALLLALGWGVLWGASASAESLWDAVYRPTLSSIELPGDLLGPEWKRGEGLKVDSFDELDSLSRVERSMATVLAKQMGPLGVVGVGDYSLARKGSPSNIVTVRAFVFVDAERCRAWWNLKYQRQDWRDHFRPIELPDAVAVDSIGSRKRAMAFGNIWLSAHHLGEGDEHLQALAVVRDAVRQTATESAASE